MANLKRLIADNGERWQSAVFNSGRMALAKDVAARLVASKAKAIYQSLEAKTGVPWYVIAVIHEREASQKWWANIAQGDPWKRVSTHIPRGRGPFSSFEAAAVDALAKCAPYAAKWKDWSQGGALTLLEMYNGTGYEDHHNMPSPYIWAGTQHYRRGKYISDGKFAANVADTQLGCAIMLRAMSDIDSDVPFSEQVEDDAPQASAKAESDPDDYPEPDSPKATSEDEPPAADGGGETVKDLIETVTPIAAGGATKIFKSGAPVVTKAGIDKVVENAAVPMLKSKQTWMGTALATLLGWFGLDKVDTSFWDKAVAFFTSPGFIVLLMIGMIGTMMYWRWRDHGRGALKTEN